jgi:hypothetical protein
MLLIEVFFFNMNFIEISAQIILWTRVFTKAYIYIYALWEWRQILYNNCQLHLCMWAKSQDFLISFAPQTKLIWQKKKNLILFILKVTCYGYCKILPSEIEQDNMPPCMSLRYPHHFRVSFLVVCVCWGAGPPPPPPPPGPSFVGSWHLCFTRLHWNEWNDWLNFLGFRYCVLDSFIEYIVA